jgi:hypothetical protein
MSSPSQLLLPTVHLNGTSAAALITDYAIARIALEDALERLLYTHHARDYYPQGGANSKQALEQHIDRCAAVRRVIDDLAAMEAYVDAISNP